MSRRHRIRRAAAAPRRDLLDEAQRRVLLGVCIVAAGAIAVPASYNYVLVPMLKGLHASETQGSLMRQLPSMTGLLVIFLAGVLGCRWGERRFITLCGILFTLGSALVMVAPVMGVAVAGLVLESVGGFSLVVVALALLSAQVSNEAARASAFSTYAMVSPIMYVVMPLLAGAVLDHSSWRLVPAVWTLSGVAILVAARVLVPESHGPRDSRELLTPALAGVVLMAAVQTVGAAGREGLVSTAALVCLGVAVLAFVALASAFRRTSSPSLSLAALRQGGMSFLLVIVILFWFANLWFYMTLGLQFIYGLNTLQTAVALLPAQGAAIGGAVVARSLLRKKGITVAGTVLLAALAASLLLSALLTPDDPLWAPIVVTALYAAAQVGAGIPLTNAIMNLAPEGEDGSASAFRSAATNIGTAVGVVVMSTIVFATFSASLTNTLQSQGLNSKQSYSVAQSIRNGVTSEDTSANYSVPLQRVERIADAQRDAMGAGLRAHGLSGAAFTGVCLLIFVWTRRRFRVPA